MAILFSATGLLFYMLYLQMRFDDPLYFLHVQGEFGAGREEKIILLPQVIYRYLRILLTVRPFDFKYYSYVQDFVLSLGSLIILFTSFLIKKIQKSYLLFAFCAYLLPTLTGTFSSMPRYILVCLPLFIYLSLKIKPKTLPYYLYLTISLIFLIINTMLFIQGYWVA